MQLKDLADKIIDGYEITKEEALELYDAPLDELMESASKITSHFFKEAIELCCISNGKCGKCSENCKFCSQSRYYNTEIQQSVLKSVDEFFKEAQANDKRGVHRFSIVTAGVRLSKAELKTIAQAYKKISSELKISCCGSLGLLDYDDFVMLKESGLKRYHNNLETSPNFFKEICTTHTMKQKEDTIALAKKAGLEICSGCILGMGESVEDRVDIALELRKLQVDSTPINILNPIKGTPLENRPTVHPNEVRRTIALFRHVLPKTVLRLAGGRLIIQKYFTDLYKYGINAEITGDMLTTAGLTVADDISAAISNQKILTKIEPIK
ncbi:MAG: biotin synthase BioB [Succinivibrio sp.]|uniref:biotin synthase BioB n=1 Tax=Succinivibrio sp. TaxID=2053619 RepID=UPI001B0824E8|nr:biotin synthase BioB [Succinivibrio sp.]MCI7252335.1 biotin synthase BioB [Succinatimonas sp.]